MSDSAKLVCDNLHIYTLASVKGLRMFPTACLVLKNGK